MSSSVSWLRGLLRSDRETISPGDMVYDFRSLIHASSESQMADQRAFKVFTLAADFFSLTFR